MFMLRKANGIEITSVQSWGELAPPQNLNQWQEGHSAMELARAWFRDGDLSIPLELMTLFTSNEITERIELEEGVVEERIRLDGFRGNQRNSDMVLTGYLSDRQRIIVGIEAKANEDFEGATFHHMPPEGAAGNLRNRIQRLSNLIFGRSYDEVIGAVQYQLLYGLAGVLIKAQAVQANFAIFVIHEFFTDIVRISDLRRNLNDLNYFLNTLPHGQQINFRPEVLFGPFAGIGVFNGINYFIGMALS